MYLLRNFPSKIFVLFIALFALILTTAALVLASPSDNEALLKAASVGDVTKVKSLLANGADINYAAKGGWTPLIIAAWYKNEELVSFLIKKGAEIDRNSDNGSTALLVSIVSGNK